MHAVESKPPVSPVSRLSGLAMGCGLVLCVIGVGFLIRAIANPTSGVDLRRYYYPAAREWIQGVTGSAVEGDQNRLPDAAAGRIPPLVLKDGGPNPTVSPIVAPFALLPLDIAKLLFAAFSVAIMAAGIWAAITVAFADASNGVRMLVFGATLCASGLRWGVWNLNVILLIIGASGLLLYADVRGRNVLLVLAGWLMLAKITMVVPLAGYLLWRRRPAVLALIVAIAVVGDVASAYRTGLMETAVAYVIELRNYDAQGSQNYPSASQYVKYIRGERWPVVLSPGLVMTPGYHATSAEYPHWAFAFSAVAGSVGRAKALANVLGLLGVAVLWILWRQYGRSCQEPASLAFVFGLIMLFSMLAVHHGRYDIGLLVYPTIGLLSRLRLSFRWDGLIAVLLCMIVGYLLTSPMLTWWAVHFVVPGNRLWLVPVIDYALTIAFVCMLLAMRGMEREDGAEAPG